MIIGKKVYLRPILKDDISILNKWKNDEETFKYLGGGFSPISIDQQIMWVDNLIDNTGNNRRFIICSTKSDLIGLIGLYEINWKNRTCEIGIFIGDKESRGHGYAKEACLLLEFFAAKNLNLRKLKLSVVEDNQAAVRLWQALGYVEVGKYIKERFIDGEYKNLIIMEKFIS